MAKKLYESGRRFEYRVRNHYTNEGYLCLRMASSKPCDLIALKKGEILLIECKYHTDKMTKEEIIKMKEMARLAGGIPILATMKKNARALSLMTIK